MSTKSVAIDTGGYSVLLSFMMKVALVLLLAVSTVASAARTLLPKPKPINQAEVYHKEQHSLCGPFLDMLPKKSADSLRRILEQEDSTKGEIDEEVERWVAGQDSDVQVDLHLLCLFRAVFRKSTRSLKGHSRSVYCV